MAERGKQSNHKHRHELEQHARTQGTKHPYRKPILGIENNCLKVEQSGSLSEVISNRHFGDSLRFKEGNILTCKMRVAGFTSYSNSLQTWFTCKLCLRSPDFLQDLWM